jgi:hypothetical protein
VNTHGHDGGDCMRQLAKQCLSDVFDDFMWMNYVHGNQFCGTKWLNNVVFFNSTHNHPELNVRITIFYNYPS